jgi:glycosyltransferase involved in cell wall biosynthesis
MKILVNGRNLEGTRTGVGRYLANILRVWTNENTNHQFKLYYKDEISSDGFNNSSNVISTLVPNSKILDYGPIWENIYLPKALNNNSSADLYFTSNYTLPIAPLKFREAVTIFDISYIAHPEWFPTRNLVALKLLTGPTVKRADIILTGSEATKKEILKYYDINHEKIHVTNLGVDEEFIELEKNSSEEKIEALKKKHNISGKIVLFIGLIMNRRNLPVIMESLSKIIKKTGEIINLVIIGKNHSYPFFDPEEVAEDFGIKEHLRWIKYTNDDEVFNFYKAADVFMCTSLYEGFNITPLEAMFAGAPVICSNLSSLPEVVGEAAYFLEDPRDPIEMEEAIANVLGDSDLQRNLSAKGKEQSKKFSWERCAKETMEIFEKSN